jgi:hypothetical protein
MRLYESSSVIYYDHFSSSWTRQKTCPEFVQFWQKVAFEFANNAKIAIDVRRYITRSFYIQFSALNLGCLLQSFRCWALWNPDAQFIATMGFYLRGPSPQSKPSFIECPRLARVMHNAIILWDLTILMRNGYPVVLSGDEGSLKLWSIVLYAVWWCRE